MNGVWGDHLGTIVNNSVTDSPHTGSLFLHLSKP
jgi:hypothetical protein